MIDCLAERKLGMYLVSLYFDDKIDARIRQYIYAVAKRTNNTYMLDGNVPPHITVSAFESKEESMVIDRLNACMKDIHAGSVHFASVGVFFPHVIYLSPVLNAYLHELSVSIHGSLQEMDDMLIRKCYQPFCWLPHSTIGKKLSAEEMRVAFATLQESFGMFSGEVVKIGLAKTNPYEDIVTWELR